MPALYPHQVTAVDFLIERGFACLYDDPGVGKSPPIAVATSAICARRVLVLCPATVREHWAMIFNTWAPSLPVHVESGLAKTVLHDGVTIMAHASLALEAPCEVIRRNAPYDAIIIDEQHELRVFQAKRTRNMFAPAEQGGIFALTQRLWCLTGTPLVNSAGDLYPLVAGPLRMNVSWWDFCSRFTDLQPDPSTGYKAVGVRRAPELADLFRPHVLRRTAESIGLKLPPLTIRPVALPVDRDEQLTAMAGLKGWTPQRLRDALERQDEISDPAISRVRHALGLAKAPFVARHMLSALGAGEGPVVTFFQHTEVCRRILNLLPDARTAVIDGKVSRRKIRETIEQFQAGQLDALLVQTQAGGVGLTLTRSNRAFVAERPWTSTALMQALARIHRISQTRPCLADILQADDCWLEV